MKKKFTCPAIVLDAIIKLYLAPTGISGEGQRHAPLSGAVDEYLSIAFVGITEIVDFEIGGPRVQKPTRGRTLIL